MAPGRSVAAHRLQIPLAKAVLIPRRRTQVSGNLLNKELSMLVGYLLDKAAAKRLATAPTITGQPGAQIRVAPLECFSHPSWGWFAGQPLQWAISCRRKVATGARPSLGKTI